MTTTTTPPPPARRSLFEIGEDFLALERILATSDGDITDPAAEAAITQWLEQLGVDQAAKADCYVALIKKWEMEQVAARAEAEQYRKAAQVRENRIARLKARLKEHMEATHQVKIETATGRTIAIQKNGGVCPLWIDEHVNPASLIPAFQRVQVSVDTDAVRAALAENVELPFAKLLPRGTSLRIR